MPTTNCTVCNGPPDPDGLHAYVHTKDCRIGRRLAYADVVAQYGAQQKGTSMDHAPGVLEALGKYAEGEEGMTPDEIALAKAELERAGGKRREDPAILQRDQELLDYLRKGQGG